MLIISGLGNSFANMCCLLGQLLLMWLGYQQCSCLECHSDLGSSIEGNISSGFSIVINKMNDFFNNRAGIPTVVADCLD